MSLVLTVFLLFGCGGAEPPLHPVRGSVFYQGKPLAEATLVFHPLDSAVRLGQKPFGITDDKGDFTLTTLRNNDGAPAGEYAITVEYREKIRTGEEMTRSGRRLLAAKYEKPETSGIRVRVNPGVNVVDKIDLR